MKYLTCLHLAKGAYELQQANWSAVKVKKMNM